MQKIAEDAEKELLRSENLIKRVMKESQQTINEPHQQSDSHQKLNNEHMQHGGDNGLMVLMSNRPQDNAYDFPQEMSLDTQNMSLIIEKENEVSMTTEKKDNDTNTESVKVDKVLMEESFYK